LTVVDTNVLIYDTFEDTSYHEDARRILDSLPEWRIPSIVLVEYIAFLNRIRLGREKILDKLYELVNDPKFSLVDVEKGDVLEALKTVENEKLSTSRLNDKIILSISKRVGENLVTFDRSLKGEFDKV
jgi:predicted nucleic acid-binding protein